MTFEGIVFRMRTGCPWHEIPEGFELSDTEWLFVGGNIIRAHQHAMGARSHKDKAINRSCGGNLTKIHLVVNSYGIANRY